MHSHCRGGDVSCDIEIRYPKVLRAHKTQTGFNYTLRHPGAGLSVFLQFNLFIYSIGAAIATTSSHLNLFALEDVADAGVEGGARKHGSDRVR